MTRTNAVVRFLRAAQLNVQTAVTGLQSTLQWRQSYLPSLDWELSVSKIAESRLVRVASKPSKTGHAVVVVRANAGGHLSLDEKVSIIVWSIEIALSMPSSGGRIVWIADFETPSEEAETADTWGFLQCLIQVMQEHYPDTMEKIILWRPSLVMRGILSMACQVLDARSVKRMATVIPLSSALQTPVRLTPEDEEIMQNLFEKNDLPVVLGGTSKAKSPSASGYKAELETVRKAPLPDGNALLGYGTDRGAGGGGRRTGADSTEKNEGDVYRAVPVDKDNLGRRGWQHASQASLDGGQPQSPGGRICVPSAVSHLSCSDAPSSAVGGAAVGGMAALVLGTGGAVLPLAICGGAAGYLYGSSYDSQTLSVSNTNVANCGGGGKKPKI